MSLKPTHVRCIASDHSAFQVGKVYGIFGDPYPMNKMWVCSDVYIYTDTFLRNRNVKFHHLHPSYVPRGEGGVMFINAISGQVTYTLSELEEAQSALDELQRIAIDNDSISSDDARYIVQICNGIRSALKLKQGIYRHKKFSPEPQKKQTNETAG